MFVGPGEAAKSAAAKVTGGTGEIPTIALDLPAMESSLVGASTERLRTALQIIDAVSQGREVYQRFDTRRLPVSGDPAHIPATRHV